MQDAAIVLFQFEFQYELFVRTVKLKNAIIIKRSMFIFSALFISQLICAQKLEVENSFEQLAFHAQNNFKSVTGAELSRTSEKDEMKVLFNSKLELQPSVSNTISVWYGKRDTTFHKDKNSDLFSIVYSLSAKNPAQEYMTIEVAPNDAPICKDILSLIEDAKDEFET